MLAKDKPELSEPVEAGEPAGFDVGVPTGVIKFWNDSAIILFPTRRLSFL